MQGLLADYWDKGSLHLVQLIIGSFAMWVATRSEPLRMRGGDLYENQRFIRSAFIVLGLTLIIGGLWGFWIDQKTR